MSSDPIPLTAQLAAVAVVASAKVYGDDAAKAFDQDGGRKNRRCLAAAVAALAGHTGQPVIACCNLLHLVDTSFYTARSKATPPFAQAVTAAAGSLAALGPAYVRPEKAVRAAAPKPGPLTAALVERPVASPVGRALRAATAEVHQLPLPGPARQARAVRGGSAYGRATTIRLKELTPRKLRYCKRFLAADWPLEDVAELFDVSPDALAIQTRARVA